MKTFKEAARITLTDSDEYTKAGAREISRWLIRKAKDITSKEFRGDKHQKKFTQRYLYISGVNKD